MSMPWAAAAAADVDASSAAAAAEAAAEAEIALQAHHCCRRIALCLENWRVAFLSVARGRIARGTFDAIGFVVDDDDVDDSTDMRL